jgi:hypothetical protein
MTAKKRSRKKASPPLDRTGTPREGSARAAAPKTGGAPAFRASVLATDLSRIEKRTLAATDSAASIGRDVSEGLSGRWEDIGPDKAFKYLETMIRNRRINQIRVDSIERDIRANNWVPDMEPIRFNDEGELIDGQHRLWAVIQSGMTVRAYVVRGFPDDVIAVIDSGKSRTIADNIGIFTDLGYTCTVGSLARIIWAENTSGSPVAQPNRRATNQELLEVVDSHPGLAEAAARTQCKNLPCSQTLIAYVYYKARHRNRELAEEWVDKMCRGLVLKASDPVYTIREFLLSHRKPGRSKRLPRIVVLALLIKSWNAMREGKAIRTARFTSKESLPKIH